MTFLRDIIYCNMENNTKPSKKEVVAILHKTYTEFARANNLMMAYKKEKADILKAVGSVETHLLRGLCGYFSDQYDKPISKCIMSYIEMILNEEGGSVYYKGSKTPEMADIVFTVPPKKYDTYEIYFHDRLELIQKLNKKINDAKFWENK